MPKLCQIVAIEKSGKNSLNDIITTAYHKVQKPEIFSGIARTYAPLEDGGEEFPSESTLVITTADDIIEDTTASWTKLLDVTATKDIGNSHAKANVVVDGNTLLQDVPVTYLIWLEKQLVDLKSFIGKLPVLDPAFAWEQAPNAGTGVYATPPVQTHKSKKVPRNHVKAEATNHHPAQVEMYMEDVLVGYWNTVKFSGALPQVKIDSMLSRVVSLQEAVKFAREDCNSIEVENMSVGNAIFSFVLND